MGSIYLTSGRGIQMEVITVGLGSKEFFLNSLLIAVLPVALLLGVEYMATKRFSSVGLLLGAAIFLLLQSWWVYQAKGKVFVEDGALHVRSGFYKAQWPLEGLSASAINAAIMGGGVRINGTAMYGFRAGWFQITGDRIFFLTTSNSAACIEQKGVVVLCLDRDVIDRLKGLI
ncbi:hypothetical protein [Pseudomonas sp. GV071]|uniref:hypothetical protein n=1 Tax=Pseudomonas sp. GV071 TaxID=2135754 RepID=UPI000D343B69|nr:hypothetical protein [Pseudomonas sp. GV071]PTQ70031.1 hypothetical protein C8K61_107247 [Pseudomonas sp. GV071]